MQFKDSCCYWFPSIPLPVLWNLCVGKKNVAWLEWKQTHARKKHPFTCLASPTATSGAPRPEQAWHASARLWTHQQPRVKPKMNYVRGRRWKECCGLARSSHTCVTGRWMSSIYEQVFTRKWKKKKSSQRGYAWSIPEPAHSSLRTNMDF